MGSELRNVGKDGLPCHDSVFQVVSQLARWFWFIEFWDLPEEMRLERIVGLMTDFCLTKHNGFISSLNAGHEAGFPETHQSDCLHAPLIMPTIRDNGNLQESDKNANQGQYRRVIFLEPVIRSNGMEKVPI